MMRILILILLILIPCNVAQAQDSGSKPFFKIKKAPNFGLPIDCRLGEDCWILNYVDYGPDDEKQTDLACLERTYDSHKGTDFAIADGSAMERGVNVIAAEKGTVKKIRNGEIDQWSSEEERAQIQKDRKECGNAVLIDHGEGLQTLYCHLKNNSIVVKAGDKVSKGAVLGEVGLSGFTEFPHVHFGILKDGKIVDPFTGKLHTEECGKKNRSYWDKELDITYQELVIQSAGFADSVLNFDDIQKQLPQNSDIDLNANALVFWTILYGAREGDKIILEIKDPNGDIFHKKEIQQDKTRARQFYFSGRKNDNGQLVEGAYTATVTVLREADETSDKPRKWQKTAAVLVKKAAN